MDQIFTQLRFTIVDPIYGTFQDAIVLLQTDYNLLTPKQITDTKTARLAGWKKAIDDAKLIPSPTKQQQLDQVIADLADFTQRVTDLTNQKNDLQTQIGGGK